MLGRALGSQPRYEAPGDLRAESTIKCSDHDRVSEVASSAVAQNWHWGNQVVVKKYIYQFSETISPFIKCLAPLLFTFLAKLQMTEEMKRKLKSCKIKMTHS